MSSARIPASAHIICQNGNHILLIKKSSKSKSWPNFWAFPGGKVDDNEFFREAGLRELQEEVGIIAHARHITQEALILNRTIQGTKMHYFGLLNNWDNMPEIKEQKLASDLQWHHIDSIPQLIIPHHKEALKMIQQRICFQEIDITP